ncbi:glycosyltransferase family 2 protein [Flavobacterium sp. CF136]|uniref:glycosyltransferase family 2 protein n=1 Tax=Flavobacterium sp. (strain CF136) TaxID=1144313 RepID=UPI000271521F|nr:glycosyltransferase family 2 protein [Flavobacterium sp. CF136]EJL66730.1 glycosyl transferase [Flavobacterium sp. CF136]
MNIDISVALATYNGSKYLKKQLISILNQTIVPREIIIVDDCSNDNTVEIIKEFQRRYSNIDLHINETNLGPINTFKNAILKCNYDFISLCDQDDIWELNKLQRCHEELSCLNDVKPCIVFSDLKMIDDRGDCTGFSFWEVQGYKPSKVNLNQLLIGNVVTGCTIMMNGRMKEEIFKMPTDIIMHDYWIALIAYSKGDFKIINDKLINYRIHQSSVTLKSKMSFDERFQFFFKVFSDDKREYLLENILQAESFFNIYGLEMSNENNKIYKNFILLKNKSSLFRKFYVFCVKYL